MKRSTVVAKIIVLLLALAGSLGCGISSKNLRATYEAELRPRLEEEARQTAEARIGTSISATLTAVPATQTVALLSFHGRFVTASGGGAGWLLRQEPHLTDCGWFTLQHLENGTVSLKTCHGRYVTAPKSGTTRADWLLWQEPELTDCGQFVLHDLSDGVAFKTCAGRFVTAGDGNWPGELAWSLVGETVSLETWERFTMLERYPPPPVIADFDNCIGATNGGQPTGEVYDPGSGDRADASFVREPGRGCIARLEYDMEGATGFWIRLGNADLSPYSQIAFDIKVGPLEDAPEEYRIELKRSDLQEISKLPLIGITTDWQTLSVNLSEFQGSLSSMADMEELVFMFEAGEGRKTGVIYLDNVVLRRD